MINENVTTTKKQFLFISILFILLNFSIIVANNSKIIALMQVRNEETIIEQHLRALAPYVDAIVIIDDASTDSTVSILKTLSQELPIKKIITRLVSSRESGRESDNSQILLQEGRALGGTHFVMLDADEMFTANCLDNNYLKKIILALKPGQVLELCWIQLWRSVDTYRFDNSLWTWNYKGFIFCDDQQCFYPRAWLHSSRTPPMLKSIVRIPGYVYGVLHFQFVNWNNLLEKQAWYRCLERIREPQKSIKEINDRYAPSKNEVDLKMQKSPSYWFLNYSFFTKEICAKPEQWRKNQVCEWFATYGKDYFKDLDIWNINWD